MRKQKRTSRDTDNPAWTKAMFARARPAREMEPDLVANPPRIGRPPLEKPKQQISLRLDPDVVAAYRSTGAGWQNLCRRPWPRRRPGGASQRPRESGAEHARRDRVFHQKFGYRRVANVEGNKLTVDFDKAAEKR
jgi:uncharacterized protein (DUF4415 family)